MTKPKVEILRTAQGRHNSEEFADLKRTQEELERAISLLNATLESIADGIAVVDLAGNTATFNQKYIEMWNLPDALVASKNTTERLAFLVDQVKDPAGFLKRVEELSNQPETEGYDIIELKDGRVFERHSRPQWLREKVVGRVWNFRDITHSKQMEEALRRNEASMAAAQRLAHVGNWETDIPTNSLYWSDEIYRIFGLAPQEFSATVDAFFSRVHPDDLAYVLKAVDDAIAGRKGYNVDHRIIQSGGEIRFVHQEAEVTYDELGKPLRFIGIVQDVTERERLELEIRQSLERRGRQVQLSTQVIQDIIAVTNLDDLYQRVVIQVKEQFGFYHAQLLRYEPNNETLAIVAGYGEVGQRMLAERYQVPLGTGLIGAAAALGASILLSDTSTEPSWQPNPHLPDTKGELVVPIKLGHQDVQAQVTALKYFINHDFDGFIVCVTDAGAVAPVAREALGKGLHVMVQSVDLGLANQTSFVGAAEYETGYMLGQQAGEWAKVHIPATETLQVGIFNHRAIPPVVQREEGIIAGLKATFGLNFEIVANETAPNPVVSLYIAERWFKTYPKLRMLLAINDGGALGAYRAAKAASKNDPAQLFIGGVDAIDEALAAIAEGGAFQATVDKSAYEEGVVALRALVAAIAGQPYQEKNIIKTRPVNRSNLAAFLAGRQAQKFDEKHALSDLDLSGIRIGLSIMNLNNPFFATFAHVIAEEAKRLGVELVINDPKPVLGVLNVLTNVADALDTEDQLALEGICGQIAAAIESTRLRQEMEDRLRELNALQRLMSREAWQAFQATRERAAQAYLFDQTSVRATTVAELGLLHNGTAQKELLASATAVSNSHIVARPMAVRGEIIGALGIQDDADAPLPPEDQAFLAAVAQQVAEALERARLLEQTQKRAAGLEAVAQVSAVTSTTLETQKLLQTAVDLTKTNFGLYHAHIYLLDEAGQNLTLAVGAGEVGQQMVAQGWQIPLNHKHSLVAQAARTRQGVMVNETRESPDFLPNPLLPETRSEVAIPLIAGDRLLGVLDVQADEINHFTEEDMQVKTVLAAQIATALRNANLYQQTQTALAETESLYNAGRRLNETGNLQEIVAAVVEGLSVPTINRAVLMMFEHDSVGEVEVMTVTANWHSGEGTLPIPIGVQYPRATFATLGLLLSSDPLFFDDVQHDERVDPATIAAWQQSNIRAMAVLPLAVGSRQLGSLLLEAEEPHPFTEHEIRLSRSIMGQATVAIENQRLFNATRAALAEVESTQRRYTVQAWETYRIKNKVLSHEQVREGVTPLAENLLPEISKTLAQRRPQSAQPPLGTDDQGPQTADRRPQLIDGGQRSPVTGQVDAADSSLIIPLMVRGETIGVLGLQETDGLRAWLPEEITLIEAIADQLAQAAENIRLIDETQQRAAREKRVNEIGEKIQAAQSLEEALQIAVKEVGLSLQAPQTSVQLEIKN